MSRSRSGRVCAPSAHSRDPQPRFQEHPQPL